jgi:excisionase family DNA binding protein
MNAQQERYQATSGALKLDPKQEAAIRIYADRVGERIGRLVSEIIVDSLTLLWAEKRVQSEPIIQQDTGDRLLTVPEVANKLSISKSMAYQMIQRGEIHCVKIGQAVRVRPQDLDDFIARGETGQ